MKISLPSLHWPIYSFSVNHSALGRQAAMAQVVEWVAMNRRLGGFIPTSSCPHGEVSLSKTPNPKIAGHRCVNG